MSKKYNVRLSSQQQKLFKVWDKKYPPSKREIVWAANVARIEGYSNPYIDSHTKG